MRIRALFSWLVILVIVSWILYGHNFDPKKKNINQEGLNASVQEFQGRLLYAAGSLDKKIAQDLIASIKVQGSVRQRLCNIVLLAELDSAKRAMLELEQLEELVQKHNHSLTARQENVIETLKSYYALESTLDNDLPVPENFFTETNEQNLKKELAWFSKLCLYPEGGAAYKSLQETGAKRVIFFALLIFVVVLMGVAGVGAWLWFVIRQSEGKNKFKMKVVGAAHHGLYLETFALWMLFYSSLSLLKLPSVYQFLSVLALLWPVCCGVSFQQVKEDLGFNFGDKWWKEILMGPLIYCKMLPVIGLCLVLLSMVINFEAVPSAADPFAPLEQAAHPVIAEFKNADSTKLLLLFVYMSVMAPLIEEIVFRGVLYRYLRDCSYRWGVLLSVLFSLLLSSLIFAAIHPQGVMAIPILMVIASGLVFAREWRGSLIPGMVVHGIHNGLLFVLMVIIAH